MILVKDDILKKFRTFEHEINLKNNPVKLHNWETLILMFEYPSRDS